MYNIKLQTHCCDTRDFIGFCAGYTIIVFLVFVIQHMLKVDFSY